MSDGLRITFQSQRGDDRFLGLIEAAAVKESGVPTSQVLAVLNWFAELKRLTNR